MNRRQGSKRDHLCPDIPIRTIIVVDPRLSHMLRLLMPPDVQPEQHGSESVAQPSSPASSSFKAWRFALISLAAVAVSVPLAFGSSTPTAGYVHWRGLAISLITASGCAISFFLCPRRPIAPKLATLALLIFPLLSCLLCGCSTPPKLTAEDKRQDMEYLARWARDCNPLITLSQEHKGLPNFDILKPHYLDFAGSTTSNEEFYLVASAYFNITGAGSCHGYLVDENYLKWSAVGQFFGISDWGMSTRRLWAASYWPKLARGLSTRAHPPFTVVATTNAYFTGSDWHHDGVAVPRGSEIIKVNGMRCSTYLDYIKTHTHLRYDPFPKDWADKYLLIIDEGPAFHGWNVEFALPGLTNLEAFVPKVPGIPLPTEPVHSIDAKENCTCIQLAENVGYVRIRSMWHGPPSYFFKGYIKKERQKVQQFLERGQGRYQKLIIDIRQNGGGVPEYVYQNLVCPFLPGPTTFKQTAGLRKTYLHDTKPSALQDLKKLYGLYVTETREVKPPTGFASEDWTFYEITRTINPRARYNFSGKLYVLIDGDTASAADDYADLVKRLKLGTLVGQNTGGGGGALLAPGVMRLPRSGMVFRTETEIFLAPDGSVNELFGTAPDVKLAPIARAASITREDLLKDEWIKTIITSL